MRSSAKISILILTSMGLFLCCESKKPNFEEWYAQYSQNQSTNRSDEKETAIFYSNNLLIDTIYRSMQGPFEIKPIAIEPNSDELLWITGYKSNVLQAESEVDLGAAFMCHNNLDYSRVEKLPWKLKTSGANHRIFTLSQGQSEIQFPKGFGIPIPADQGLHMVSQVLNHHRPELYLNTKHQSEISYLKDSELDRPMKALYQQSVFVTRQISGAEGAYGTPLQCLPYHKHEEGSIEAKVEHDCSIQYDENGEYNPYEDKYGRKYTGHWVLPFGPDTLKTNVSQMLDLDESSKIHFISTHLHPYAEALELWDLTQDQMLYASQFDKDSLNFGFQQIDTYSDSIGIAVYPDHQYELRTAYNCTDSLNEHTAMAVMYLYLAE